MPFPKDATELKSAGYRFDNHAKCRGCGDEIEWYITPKGSKLPMNLMPTATDQAVPHWTTCPNAEDFRKSR